MVHLCSSVQYVILSGFFSVVLCLCIVYHFVFFQLSYVLVQFDYFVCPISYDDVKHQISYECERHPVFILTEVNLHTVAQKIFSVVSKIYLLNGRKNGIQSNLP